MTSKTPVSQGFSLAPETRVGRGLSPADPTVYVLDPLTDPRWPEFLDRTPRASVFHSRGWLEALKRTYGYEPFALTTTERGPLENGLAMCRVRTWTSRRLVSLPFSDHCDPLVDRLDDLSSMLHFLAGEMRKGGWRSLALRPRSLALDSEGTCIAEPPAGRVRLQPCQGAETARRQVTFERRELAEGEHYCLHTLDISRNEDQIFSAFHHSSTQRAIRRAEREGVSYEAGRSQRLLGSFYYLLRQTRRRHGLPPQPLTWFRNLVACMGDNLAVHVSSKNGQPVAAILTLSFKKSMVYKYGGSDARYHHLGGMPFLFWEAIRRAKHEGIEELDLGRSDVDQPGLVAFKDHLGATRATLTYYDWPQGRKRAVYGLVSRTGRRVIARLPDAALDLTGRLLYKHLG